MTEYDPQNIFGKIVRGEFPSTKVYENEHLIAIMDVFPQSKGHTLVIPKAGSRNILDADPAALSKVAADLPRLARAVKTAMKADGLRVMQFNEAPSGQTVFHLHNSDSRTQTFLCPCPLFAGSRTFAGSSFGGF